MADRIWIKTQGLDEMINAFDDMSKPGIPKRSGERLDAGFDAAFESVKRAIHGEGYLKDSGRHSTHYIADMWIGEMRFARDPGIFELNRGDEPTDRHPEGGHFFFDAAEFYEPVLDNLINRVFDGYFKGRL